MRRILGLISVLALVVAFAMPVVTANAASHAKTNPCNPCAAKDEKMKEQPCNPCAKKAMGEEGKGKMGEKK